MFFVGGVLLGGLITHKFLTSEMSINITKGTQAELISLGISDFSSYIPVEIFSWNNLFTLQGFLFIVLGGFMVGFGARWAGGCTSGHAISGLSNFRFVSLIAVIGFFIGGMIITHFVLPIIF